MFLNLDVFENSFLRGIQAPAYKTAVAEWSLALVALKWTHFGYGIRVGDIQSLCPAWIIL